MDLSRQESVKILKELGVMSEDNRQAEFYYHSVFDNDASTGEAKAKAVEYAKYLSEKNKCDIIPDFSINNLKRLGAKTVMKDELYIKINHFGSKQIKSRKATEQDKIIFKQAWEKFNEQNHEKNALLNRDNIQERTIVGHNPSRQQNSSSQIVEIPRATSSSDSEKENWQAFNFNYEIQIS